VSLSLLASGFECCTNSKRKRNLTEAKFVQLQLNELIRDSMGHFQGRPSPPAQWGGSFRIARILQLFRAGFRAGAAKPVKRRCYLRKHRVTPCRKQRCAPFPARLEPPGATRGPALLPSPGLPWDLGAGARNGRSPSPDHRISRFAPGRIYVVRHPCAGQGPLRSDSYGGPARRRPMDRAGPSAPKTGDYVIRDAWLHHGSRPQTPVDPYRPRTR